MQLQIFVICFYSYALAAFGPEESGRLSVELKCHSRIYRCYLVRVGKRKTYLQAIRILALNSVILH